MTRSRNKFNIQASQIGNTCRTLGSRRGGFAYSGAGRDNAVALLRGMVAGYFGFSVFCVTLAIGLRESGVGTAFALALGCALVVHLVARRVLVSAPPVLLTP